MPQFVLDMGGAADTFSALDSFTQGYIEAAFFTECEPGTTADTWDTETQSSLPGDMTVNDLAPETLAAMKEDCAAFQELAKVDLEKAYDYAPADYDANRAGNDFWYTRNGHGTGFWDRGLGDLRTETVGGRLSRDAKSFGECSLYRGDDGLIYC